MNESHACELLYRASLTLATGAGEIHERLTNAVLAMSHLLPDRELNAEHRPEYDRIMKAVTTRSAEIAGEGTIHATIRHMSDEEASKVAQRIFHLYGRVLHGFPV